MRGKMRKSLYAAALLAIAANASAADQDDAFEVLADKMIGTVSAGNQRVSNDGDLKACGMDFIALGRDFSTKQGALFKAVGSYYFRNTNGYPQFWLKLGVFDVDPRNPDSLKISNIGNAHVAAGKQAAIKPKLKIDSDTPGFYIYIFEGSEETAGTWFEFLKTGKLLIGFNRISNQQDVVFKFDGTVSSAKFVGDEFIRQHSREQLNEVESCTDLLLKTF
jgi:hypothetical protein